MFLVAKIRKNILRKTRKCCLDDFRNDSARSFEYVIDL